MLRRKRFFGALVFLWVFVLVGGLGEGWLYKKYGLIRG